MATKSKRWKDHYADPEVSTIGLRLRRIIKDQFKAVECSECKAAITRLNMQTPDEVEANRADIIADIASRAAEKAPTWWQRLAVKADQSLGTGQVDAMIGGWLDEAIQQERDAQNADQSPVGGQVS